MKTESVHQQLETLKAEIAPEATEVQWLAEVKNALNPVALALDIHNHDTGSITDAKRRLSSKIKEHGVMSYREAVCELLGFNESNFGPGPEAYFGK
jgi:hypothetical protein